MTHSFEEFSPDSMREFVSQILLSMIRRTRFLSYYIGQDKVAGSHITLTLYRNGHAIDLKATLSARPSLLPFLTTRTAPHSVPHPPIRAPTIPHP